ncbi:MAG: tetratricopeptide repeat protein [Microscillaceae bacterium]|nr:tetratricopeptide repeat protein [Microscillaceae bacterium]MDW8461751.1 tetratricopeptide repeat protein [Cytophagales bacterium]
MLKIIVYILSPLQLCWLVGILLWAVPFLNYAQVSLDSLEKLLKGVQMTSKRADNLVLMSKEIQKLSAEKGLIYAQQALLVSQKIAYQKGICDALYYIAQSYYNLGNYTKTVEYANRAVKHYTTLNDYKGILQALTLSGNANFYLGEYETSFKTHIERKNIAEKNKDNLALAEALISIGNVYLELREYKLAIEKYEKSLSIAEKYKNQNLAARNYNNLATAFEKQRQYARALEYYQKALSIFTKLQDVRNIANTYNGISDVYLLQKKHNEALKNCLTALKFQEAIRDKNGACYSKMTIGIIYFETKNYARAIDYLQQSLVLAKEMRYKEVIKTIYQKLSEIYEETNQIAQAYANHKLYKVYNDSILNESKIAQVVELQMRLGLADKESEIETLNKQKSIQEQIISIKETNIQQQRLIIGLFIGLVLILMLLAILFYRARAKEIKINQQLTAQNEEIVKKNAEIEKQREQLSQIYTKLTDSIRYAETIQKAILPSEQRIKEVLKEYFIIYQAKDIVSGDFYWMYQAEGKIFLAVIDCTGHGVAGGFMSMIGHTLLNEIVTQKKTYAPSDILQQLHKGVVNALEEQYLGIDVGMEVCLCTIENVPDNENRRKIIFAGAKRPLFYVQDNQLLELRGERKSIGFNDNRNFEYKSHQLYVDKGTILYLATDGIVDQAGKDGSRFGTMKFKNLLQKIKELPLAKQKMALQKALEEFQQDIPQRDDITILGVKI